MHILSIMKYAYETIKPKWGIAIVSFFVYFLLTLITGEIEVIGTVTSILIGGPLAIGAASIALSITRNKSPRFKQLFHGFNYFGNALIAHVLICVFTFIWLMCFIVPGIMAALSYSMTFFILSDNPEMKAMDAIDKSVEMMENHKLRLFYLCLRFAGLSILCLFTLGIGFLWLFPYMHVCLATFYEKIKN